MRVCEDVTDAMGLQLRYSGQAVPALKRRLIAILPSFSNARDLKAKDELVGIDEGETPVKPAMTEIGATPTPCTFLTRF